MNDDKARLFDALVSSRGLQHLLDTASGILKLPLILCDDCWIIRFFSGLDTQLDSLINTNTRGQLHIAPDILQQFDSAMTRDSRKVKLQLAGQHCLIRSLGSDPETPLAYLILISDRDRQGIPRQAFIEIFCQALLCELEQEGGRHLALQSAKEAVLHSLLDPAVDLEPGIADKAFKTDQERHQFICVVDAQLGKSISSAAMLELMNKVSYETLIVHNGYPVLLIRMNAFSLQSYLDARAELSSQLKSVGLSCGVSYPFRRIEDLALYHRQAVMAMAFGAQNPQTGNVTAYIDIAGLDLVALCGAGAARNDLPPALQDVLRSDEERKTNYFETVAACVESGGNIKDCARLLGVRWSTLNNRIVRIHDLFGIDLKDDQTISDLYFASCLVRLQKMLAETAQ